MPLTNAPSPSPQASPDELAALPCDARIHCRVPSALKARFAAQAGESGMSQTLITLMARYLTEPASE